ncbi:MAG: porin family protein [Chitinophagaceae bacterium]
MIQKLSAFTICLILSSFMSQAQFRVGPTGGLNFNRQVFKSNTNRYEGLFRSRLGFHVGLQSDLILNKHMTFQSELLYTLKGGYFKSDRVNVSEEYWSDLSYVQLPLMLTYKLDVNKAYIFVAGGPFLSKLIHTAHRYYSNGENIENGQLRIGLDIFTDQIKPWDAGVKLKAGFELKKGFSMSAFYDISTADINPQFTVTRNKTFGVQWAFLFSTTEEDRYNRFESFYEF